MRCSRCGQAVRGNAAAEKYDYAKGTILHCRQCFNLDTGILGSREKAVKAWQDDGWEMSSDLLKPLVSKETPAGKQIRASAEARIHEVE